MSLIKINNKENYSIIVLFTSIWNTITREQKPLFLKAIKKH